MKATIPQLAPVEEVRRRLIESGGRRAEAEEQARQNSARSLKTRLLLSHQQGSNGRHAGPPLRLLSGCLRAAQGKKTHWEGRGVRADRENLPGNRRTGAADRAGEGAQTRGAGPGEGRGAQDRRAQTGRHQNTQSHSAPGGRQTAGAHAIQKKNNRLRDQSSTQNNRLGRTVHKIGLQEHSNHMFFYHYRKHLFHDHGRAFSPILRGSRERPLSPCSSSGTIVAKRRASSGSVFRHSARPLA